MASISRLADLEICIHTHKALGNVWKMSTMHVWKGLCVNSKINWQLRCPGFHLSAQVSRNMDALNQFIINPAQRLLKSSHCLPAAIYSLRKTNVIKGLGGFFHSFPKPLMLEKHTDQLAQPQNGDKNLWETVDRYMNREKWARPWLTSFWGCLWPQAELQPQMLSLFW